MKLPESPSPRFKDMQENLYQVGKEYSGDLAKKYQDILQKFRISAEDYAEELILSVSELLAKKDPLATKIIPIYDKPLFAPLRISNFAIHTMATWGDNLGRQRIANHDFETHQFSWTAEKAGNFLRNVFQVYYIREEAHRLGIEASRVPAEVNLFDDRLPFQSDNPDVSHEQRLEAASANQLYMSDDGNDYYEGDLINR